MALLLALAAPVAAQTGTPSAESPGNVAAGEGSATGNPSAGGGNSQSGGGVAPVATRAPAPRRVVAMPAPAAPRAMTPAVRSAPAPVRRSTPAPDRAAARARAERAARRERAARKARAGRAARREREAARRGAVMADRNAVEGPVETDSAPPAGDVEPKVELEPAASRGSSGGVSLGTDLTTPLLLLSAVAALALATRYTVRSLRQE